MSGRPALRTTDYPEFDGLFRCNRCDLISLQPYPSPDKVASFYLEEGNHQLLSDAEVSIPIRRRIKLIERLHGSEPGSIYEIGASRGDFLAAMRGRGWRVAGIEPGRVDCELARERYGIEQEHGFFTPDSQGDASYDVLLCWDVLEHCREPAEIVRAMLTYLRPGGIAYFAVPHIDGQPARRLRERWRYRMTPRHIHFFPLDWFEQLARDQGLEIVSLQGFAKVHAWVQALLPESLRDPLMQQMPTRTPVGLSGDSTKTRRTKRGVSQTLRSWLRGAILRANQTPCPLPMADLIEIGLQKSRR